MNTADTPVAPAWADLPAYLPLTIDFAKDKAKQLKKASSPDQKLSTAQELTAKAMGHKTWRDLVRAWESATPAERQKRLDFFDSELAQYLSRYRQADVLCEGKHLPPDFEAGVFVAFWALTEPPANLRHPAVDESFAALSALLDLDLKRATKEQRALRKEFLDAGLEHVAPGILKVPVANGHGGLLLSPERLAALPPYISPSTDRLIDDDIFVIGCPDAFDSERVESALESLEFYHPFTFEWHTGKQPGDGRHQFGLDAIRRAWKAHPEDWFALCVRSASTLIPAYDLRNDVAICAVKGRDGVHMFDSRGALPPQCWTWLHVRAGEWTKIEGKFELWCRGEHPRDARGDMANAVDRDADKKRPIFCLRGLSATPQPSWNIHPFKLGPFSSLECDVKWHVYAGDTSRLKVSTTGATRL